MKPEIQTETLPTLALTAQVVDKFWRLPRHAALAAQYGHGKAVHVEGSRYAKAHKDSFEALRKTARETSDHFKNIFQPAMARAVGDRR